MNNQNSIRKAAILISSLDEGTARRMFGEMSAAQASALRAAVDKLGAIDPAEQSAVIEEFFRIGPIAPPPQPFGVELDIRSHEQPLSYPAAPPRYTPVERLPSRPVSKQPFHFLHDADGASVAARLQHEHPQTIAVVVSHLPPDSAADLLANLPAELQVDVARRLIDLDETDPETLHEIERGLESWLSDLERSSRRRTAGMATLENILTAGGLDVRDRLLTNLERNDRRLASQLRPKSARSFSFSDLQDLEDAALIKLFAQSTSDVLTLALSGSGRSLVSRALRLLPPARAARLRRELAQEIATDIEHVERAQQQLVELADTLERRGQLTSTTGRKLSLAI